MTGSSACARVRARLPIALDGGLAPLEAALDRGHLEACAGCRAERAQHERLLVSIRALSAARVPELDRVWETVLAHLPGRRSVASADAPRRLAAGVAAAAAAAWFGILLAVDGTLSPRSVDLASLHTFLERLPRWADVARGLSSLSAGLLDALG